MPPERFATFFAFRCRRAAITPFRLLLMRRRYGQISPLYAIIIIVIIFFAAFSPCYCFASR